MKNRIVLKYYFLILSIVFASANIIVAQNTFSVDSVVARMDRQLQLYPQEKIYVHNDKPLYISGERVWLRAHLVDALTHKYDSTSMYVYGELINPLDSIVDRVKIRRDDFSYAGYFDLKEDYPAGTYSMRFYTKYMENVGDDYFFKKSIEIGGPFTSKFQTELSQSYSNNNKKLTITLQFREQATGEIIAPEKIAVGTKKEDFHRAFKEGLKKMKLNDDLKISVDFNVSKELVKNVYIEYEYDGDFHCEFIPISAPKDDFHVDFFPEGGHLLNEVQMNIAFKALYSDGLSASIKGAVYSEDGDTITRLNTIHNGMGTFPFYAELDKKYFAKCETEKGMTKIFALPQVEYHGCNLAVQRTQNALVLLLQTAGEVEEGLSLVLHSKGHIIFATHWDKLSSKMQFDPIDLPTGVIHSLLINKDYEPISERLFFNFNPRSKPELKISNNKKEYLRRDKVVSQLNFKDSSGNPLSGSFSVSVTDNKDVSIDDTQNILTNLLLTSELKGYIENPSFYFQNGRTQNYILDILMQTQGWRKYNLPNVLKGDLELPKHIREYCQMITGDVRDGLFVNKKSKDIPVLMLAMAETSLIVSELSDEDGRFMFKTDFPDSLSILLRATTKKGGNRVLLEVDEERFPPFEKSIPIKRIEKNFLNSFFDKADLKYTLESGMRLINLRDVEVTGRDLRSKQKRSQFSSSFNPIYSVEDFSRTGAHTLKDVLMRLAGVNVRGDYAYIRANTKPAMFYVDDHPNPEFLELNPSVDDLETVELVKDGTAAIFGFNGANGVILVTTKRGLSNAIPTKPPLNITKIIPLGYQKKAQFYSPKYETIAQKNDPKLDLRTTLYWNPCVKIEDGNAEISFYTADEASRYTLLLEGVSTNGLPLHLKETIGDE